MAGKRGFASMDKDKQLAIATRGGYANSNRPKWTSEQARQAGRKGGTISRGGGRRKKQA